MPRDSPQSITVGLCNAYYVLLLLAIKEYIRLNEIEIIFILLKREASSTMGEAFYCMCYAKRSDRSSIMYPPAITMYIATPSPPESR